jgi:hypothetical protein
VARLSRRIASAVAVVAAAAGLAACGGGANTDAIATCHGVHLAIVAYDASLTAPTSASKQSDLLRATHEISLVQQDAAMANSSDGSYDALMTLVQQAEEVPFKDVVSSLTTVCKTIDSPTNYL